MSLYPRKDSFHNIEHVRGRVKTVVDSRREKPLPGLQPEDWKILDESRISELDSALDAIHQSVALLGNPEELATLNPDAKFPEHIAIMDSVWHQVWQSEKFRTFAEKEQLSKGFLLALDHLHDFGRLVFNGTLPLLYIDKVSGSIFTVIFPNFPSDYFHSILWISGEKHLPDKDEELSTPQIIGLMLKAVDTLGKRGADGKIHTPDALFGEGGAYNKWLDRQKESGRLPFSVLISEAGKRRRDQISPEVYAARDKALTLRGVQLLEQISGLSYDYIVECVERDLQRAKSNS